MSSSIGGDSANSRFSAETITEWFSNALASTTADLSEIAQMISVSIGVILMSIGGFSLISISIGGARAKSRNKGRTFYKFRVKENDRPTENWKKEKDDPRLVRSSDLYWTSPEFIITNLSESKWKIRKMCVAKLPWVKFVRVSIFGCNKGYKAKKLKIIRELLFDDGDRFQSDDECRPTPIKRALYCRDWNLPVAQGDERTILAANTLPAMFLYENTLIDTNKKVGWLKAHIDSKRYYWVAMNAHECLVGDRAECVGKEMRSRRKA